MPLFLDRYLNKDLYELEDRGDVQFKGRSDKMHCWFLNGHKTRPPTDISLDQARRISTLLDNMAEDEELRNMPLSPVVSASNTPRTSTGDDPRLSASVTSTDGSGSGAPRRKRSSTKPPSLEALPSAAGHIMAEHAHDVCNGFGDHYVLCMYTHHLSASILLAGMCTLCSRGVACTFQQLCYFILIFF